ncbi:MAG: methionine adenosyltransferase [Candidatus Bathyarchaeia archaeon]
MLLGGFIVEKLETKPVKRQGVEIVERKGRGHPDYIADAVSESVSRELCKFYRENLGYILHHNVDKGLVVGGRASPRFGGGEVEEPIYVVVAGRAVTQVSVGTNTVKVPMGNLTTNAMKEFFKRNFRFLDVEKHVVVDHRIREGSVDLVRIFDRSRSVPLANDTSFGVGFAPLTQTENLVFNVERYLNSEKFKGELPEVGEDIKVMGLRKGRDLRLTISAAIISSLTPDASHYLSVKEEVKRRVEDFAAKMTNYDVEVDVNVGDNLQAGIYYLTVTGTSAERGDDGNTGRGNRMNGLITPCRQMSLEATAGKNPVNHVGKIYNVLAKLIAEKISREVKFVEEVYVKILSQIGKPITEPLITHVQLVPEKGFSLENTYADVQSIVEEEFKNLSTITDLILDGKVDLF